MLVRPVSDDDLPAVVALQQSWDTSWFGAPEHDDAEVRKSLQRATDPEHTRVLLDGPRLLAAAWCASPSESTVVVDPGVDAAPLYDDLLPWLRGLGSHAVEALDRDTVLQEGLARHGWEHQLSSYELIRPVAGWDLETPTFADGVTVTSLTTDDEALVHALIYDEAGWASVPGHHARDLDDWRDLFLDDDVPRDQQVLCWRDGRLVGVALGQTFSDGTGWVAQLAVPADLQGQGLGRPLLLEALRRRVAAGATALGLGVSARNPDALRLYLGVGLQVEREWRTYSSL